MYLRGLDKPLSEQWETWIGLAVASFPDPYGEITHVADRTQQGQLGADVTVVDISEENQRYALELARAAGVCLDYIVADV